MNRRHFLEASCLAGAAPLTGFFSSAAPAGRQYFEWRHYQLIPGDKRNLLNDYLSNAYIPALNRLGIGPVGAFSVRYGLNSPSLYVMIVHPSLESVLTTGDRLAQDAAYRSSAAPFVDTGISEPAYLRMESSFLTAFSGMPRLEAPSRDPEKKDRVYEYRIYESHSEKAGKKKIEMFNEGGEIQIFRNTGLTPVFFGETVLGPRMPNLSYMLVFDDMEQRDRSWAAFVDDKDWKTLSAKEEYKDTVSNISDLILRATPYSQI